MARTVADQTSLIRLSENEFESVYNPERMGNTANIAYGGITSGAAVKAAFESLPNASYHLYSALGNFLGPAFNDRKLLCTVRDVRTTRSFATRQVDVKQIQDDGQYRICMLMMVDFHVQEPSLLTYSTPPTLPHSDVDSLPSIGDRRDRFVKDGKLSQKLAEMSQQSFALMQRFYEQRPCPKGVAAQNLSGMLKRTETSQDHLPITSKRSADWVRVKPEHKLNGSADQLAAVAFLMDGGLSFLPLAHNHMFLDDAAACSTLDSALRIFRNGDHINFSEWHLRETKTVVAAEGRTFSDAHLWDQQGNMVASMSQQNILRPKQIKNGKL